MGTFATTTALQTLLPGVSFDTATTSLCSICITWAEGFVRSSLSRRYDMSASPFNTSTSIPTQITSITEKMAMGYYFKNSSRGSKESIARGEALLQEGKDELLSISRYDVDLLDNSYSLVSERGSVIYASTSSYHTTFNEDNPLDWKVDADKLSDISSERS